MSKDLHDTYQQLKAITLTGPPHEDVTTTCSELDEGGPGVRAAIRDLQRRIQDLKRGQDGPHQQAEVPQVIILIFAFKFEQCSYDVSAGVRFHLCFKANCIDCMYNSYLGMEAHIMRIYVL